MIRELPPVAIQSYLESIGVTTKAKSGKIFASSPFSRDSEWSFCIYPATNSYFDFSTGHGGNILNLVSKLNNCSFQTAREILQQGKYEKYKPNYKQYKQESKFWEDFDIEKYINTNEKDCAQIENYAKGRGITEGYVKAVFFTRNNSDSGWTRNSGIGFVHVNKFGKPCGIKIRRIKESPGSRDQSPRFSARGVLGFYVLESHGTLQLSKLPVLYVVESESSANSLWMYLQRLNVQAVVISRGGVSSAPKLDDLPEKYRYMKKKLIIDYDGNEELYQQRLKLYEDLKAEPIKLILPKGEDINSLYVKDKIDIIDQLIL